jgi:hypothetical protein
VEQARDVPLLHFVERLSAKRIKSGTEADSEASRSE